MKKTRLSKDDALELYEILTLDGEYLKAAYLARAYGLPYCLMSQAALKAFYASMMTQDSDSMAKLKRDFAQVLTASAFMISRDLLGRTTLKQHEPILVKGRSIQSA